MSELKRYSCNAGPDNQYWEKDPEGEFYDRLGVNTKIAEITEGTDAHFETVIRLEAVIKDMAEASMQRDKVYKARIAELEQEKEALSRYVHNNKAAIQAEAIRDANNEFESAHTNNGYFAYPHVSEFFEEYADSLEDG